MSKQENLLITVASWEDRFRLGIARLLGDGVYTKVLMFYFSEYAEWTTENRAIVAEACKAKSIGIDEQELSFDSPAKSWQTVYRVVDPDILGATSYILDITTMPRETIWTVLWRLEATKAPVKYVYHKPETYGQWLSRDPGKPRLVFKLSGEANLGVPTKLVILTGYDTERVQQIIRFFEPDETILGLQGGKQYDSDQRNAEKHRECYRHEPNVNFFDVDAYGRDHGFQSIASVVAKFTETHNVVLTSLGPKLSAVSLYKVHGRWPRTGLVYAPSSDFNRDYSHGIRESVWGDL